MKLYVIAGRSVICNFDTIKSMILNELPNPKRFQTHYALLVDKSFDKSNDEVDREKGLKKKWRFKNQTGSRIF